MIEDQLITVFMRNGTMRQFDSLRTVEDYLDWLENNRGSKE